MTTPENPRPPVPPFDRGAAMKKVRLAEDAWNSRDPEKVAGAYTIGSVWRNRSEFLSGREAIIQFSQAEVDTGIGLSTHQRVMGFSRKSDRGPICV